ncbi:MAG: class I SAM-dependent methyltransferase [Dehalococcoidia bacterium]|nr:class I SAM-dependent methyltransferase [Dehalococcoidia bacterium]
MAQEQNLIQWIYASKNEQELRERYDYWAKTYETDLTKDFGWYGPLRAVEAGVRYIPEGARVLDAGAGTGLVGRLLAEEGYANLVAMDLSEGMLAEARKKDVYNEFHQMVMGEILDFPSDSFDAVISVGVLTVGHAPASSLYELVRVTRPGGHIIYTLRPDLLEEGGFKEKHVELEAAGKWKLAEVTEPTQILPKGEPDVFHQVWVFEVTS